MKVLIPAIVLFATLSGGSWGLPIEGSNGLNLLDEKTWRIAKQGDDHITYVRRGLNEDVSLAKILNIDCNETTTKQSNTLSAAPTVNPASLRSRGSSSSRSSQSLRGSNVQLRSGDGLHESSSHRRSSSSVASSSGTIAGGELSSSSSRGASGSSSSSRGASSASSSSSSGASNSGNTIIDVGNPWWVITRQTDDHITYTRKNATGGLQQSAGQRSQTGGQGQGQDQEDGLQQGKLTKIGKGDDSVLVRVVQNEGDNDELTEEGLLAGQGQNLRQRQHSGYPTSELVHPYVKKTNRTLKSLRSGSGTRKQVKSLNRKHSQNGNGDRNGQAGEGPSALAAGAATGGTTTSTAAVEDDTPPRVGDEVNGWRVIAKNNDQISWERIGSTSSSSSSSSSSSNSATGQGLALRSLDSHSGSASGLATRSGLQGTNRQRSGAGWRTSITRTSSITSTSDSSAQRQLIPSAEGEVVEGFPRVFNTYSRALFGNESDIDSQATIRTSLTNTTNWNLGDELAGWRVIGKDYRGIIWEKITNKTITFEQGTGENGVDGNQWGAVQDGEGEGSLEFGEGEIINEEDLLGGLNSRDLKSGPGGDLDDLDNASGEDGNGLGYKVPAGTWYLAKETKNSVTWRRDGVPETLVFNMDDYPRVGDTDSLGQWKVDSKAKDFITWVRISSLKDDSQEKAN